MLICALLFTYLQDAPPATKSETRGLVKTSEAAFAGYTLIAPLQSTDTVLIDMQGEPVHRWKSDAPPGQSVYLTEAGHLLRAERVDNPVFHGGGQGGRIREFDWEGQLLWEYTLSDERFCLHHDFELLPNGNLLVIAWEAKTPEQARAAGIDPQRAEQGWWPDCVLEIAPVRPSGGKIVWEWHAADHLVQERDANLPNYAPSATRPERIDSAARGAERAPGADPAERARLRGLGYIGEDSPSPAGERERGPRGGGGMQADWMHTNGIDHDRERDLIVLSLRNLSELWVIDHSTTSAEAASSKGGKYGKGGDLLARYGNPQNYAAGSAKEQQLFHQHDAQFIAKGLPGAGNLLVFNNGAKDGSSEAVELSLVMGPAGAMGQIQPVWKYGSKRIYSSHISGVQRLPNGNTLITSGESGLLLEVNAKGEELWEWKSTERGEIKPRGAPGGRGGRGGPAGRGGPGGPGSEYSLFRADRYALDYPGLAKLRR